jgi:hypothetical protein
MKILEYSVRQIEKLAEISLDAGRDQNVLKLLPVIDPDGGFTVSKKICKSGGFLFPLFTFSSTQIAANIYSSMQFQAYFYD